METNLANVGKLLAIISQIKTPSFIRVLNYSNDKGNGEVANYTINLGISYGNAKMSDTELLKDAKNFEGIDFGTVKPFAELARLEMLEARLNPTQETINRSEAQEEAYVTVCPNVRVHKQTGRVFIYGLVVRKDVIVVGSYKKVNSKDLTIAKNKIGKILKATQFRELAFDKLDTVKAKGEEIEITVG